MAEFLLELYAEETPALLQEKAAKQLGDKIGTLLKRLSKNASGPDLSYGPRRMALVARDLPVSFQPPEKIVKGPRVAAPSAAVDGFLRKNGLRSTSDCLVISHPKGAYYQAIRRAPVQKTAVVLADALPALLKSLTWPKSMYWADGRGPWIRPLRSILALFDGEVLPFSFAGVQAGATTCGHALLRRKAFFISDYADYMRKLRDNGVIPEQRERMERIQTACVNLCLAHGCEPVENPRLLKEVAGLLEWPRPRLGRMDAVFLDLPEEVLLTAICGQQKYFAMRRADGSLAETFIVVTNAPDETVGRKSLPGYEKVLQARLHDARFLYEEDKRTQLDALFAKLHHVVYIGEMGSLADRAHRLGELTRLLCGESGRKGGGSGGAANAATGLQAKSAHTAGRLAKLDLVTHMVGEFPALQGVMGGCYAPGWLAGSGFEEEEIRAVALALAGQYKPAGPSDPLPEDPLGVRLSLAEKTDSLLCLWLAGHRARGSGDAFGVRRSALAIIRLCMEARLCISLEILLDHFVQVAGKTFHSQQEKTPRWREEVLSFMRERLLVFLQEKGFAPDHIRAAMHPRSASAQTFPLVLQDKLEAMAELRAVTKDLVTLDKRIMSLLKGAKIQNALTQNTPDEKILREKAEKDLYKALAEARMQEQTHRSWKERLQSRARLCAPAHQFFDEVLVFCDDSALRRNRLALLGGIAAHLGIFADFAAFGG